MQEPTTQQTIETSSRAKEIDHGTLVLPMENIILGLASKPGPRIDDQSSVSANPWSFSELVSQKKLIGTYTITPDTKSNEIIWQFQHSWKNVFDLHFRTLQNLFTYKSWTINFHFQFRSNFQQVGMATLAFLNLPKLAINYYINPQQDITEPILWFQLPHRKIMMGEDQDVTVSLKWISPWKSSFDMASYSGWHPAADETYDMGSLYLFAPFPMEVATGVDPTMTVRIWSSLSDLDYSGYAPRDEVL